MSWLRGFSAPIRVTGGTRERVKFLALNDGDQFARWDAAQRLAREAMHALIEAYHAGIVASLDHEIIEVFGRCLADAETDPAFAAELLRLPAETMLADEMAVIDVEAIHQAHVVAATAIGRAHETRLVELYERLADRGPYTPAPEAMGKRACATSASPTSSMAPARMRSRALWHSSPTVET